LPAPATRVPAHHDTTQADFSEQFPPFFDRSAARGLNRRD